MADAPGLVAKLSADLSEYKRKMGEAGDIAEREIKDVEQKFEKANPSIAGKFLTGFIGGVLGSVAIDKLIERFVEANNQLVRLDDAAKRLGLTLERIQEFRFAANLGGIGDAEFVRGLESLGQKINDAGREETKLGRLFEANNVLIRQRNGELIATEQAILEISGLVRNAATQFDKIKIAELAGLSREWVGILEKGPEAFLRSTEAARATGAILDNLAFNKAREFKEQWDKHATEWANNFRTKFGEILPVVDDLIKKVIELVGPFAMVLQTVMAIASLLGKEISEISQLKFPTLQGRTLAELDVLANSGGSPEFIAAVERQRAALIGAMNAATMFAEAKVRALAAPASPTDGPATVIPGKDRNTGDAFTRQEEAILKRISLMQAETATVGLGTEARARARAEAELLTAAEKAGIPITEQLRATIGSLADAYGQVSIRLEKAKQDFEKFVELQNFFGNQMISAIMGMVSGTEKLSDSMKRLANSIAQAALQALLLGQGPLSGLFNTTAPKGGAGGLLALLFKSFSGTFATGGYIPAGKWGVTGEKGPEITYGGRNGVTVAPISSSRGGGLTVMVSSNPVFQAGMTPTDMAQIRAMLAQNNRVLSGEIVSGIRSGNRNDPGALYR